MLLAWLVHLLTASGTIVALLALTAIEREDWRLALLWLLAALAIDGVDGSLARLARVKQLVPRIDGDALDLVVDYLNYVFVPALFIWRAGLVPPPVAPALCAAILLSSLYVFARADMKTEDGYFRGFPALWNVVALYLFAVQPGAEIGAVMVASLAVMSFAPVHFVHPFRVRDYGVWLPVLALLWAAASAPLLLQGWSPPVRAALLWTSVLSGLALIALGLLRTCRPAPARVFHPPKRRSNKPSREKGGRGRIELATPAMSTQCLPLSYTPRGRDVARGYAVQPPLTNRRASARVSADQRAQRTSPHGARRPRRSRSSRPPGEAPRG